MCKFKLVIAQTHAYIPHMHCMYFCVFKNVNHFTAKKKQNFK